MAKKEIQATQNHLLCSRHLDKERSYARQVE